MNHSAVGSQRVGSRRLRSWRTVAGVAVASIAFTGLAPAMSFAQSASREGLSQYESAAVTLSASRVQPGDAVPLDLVKERGGERQNDMDAYGAGIDVALIDSGVAPVPGLDQAGKVLYGPDLSNEGGIPNLANLDTYGHGTHMAGIIAGDDGDKVGGIATASRIISVKVAGATGETDVAQVIAGIDWVVEHRNDPGLNIRVLNLSLGLPGTGSSAGDPLAAAVERAWMAGIVVVAAAGNRGNETPIDSPAVSPFVIAVGSVDSYHGKGKGDVLSSWSSGGSGARNPDVVAPGRSLVSFRVPGSMLDVMNPAAVVDEVYFRGSGTSQAAAVVSGFAAALLSARPSLTPDQVKFLFTSSANQVDKKSSADGAGSINPNKILSRIKKMAAKAPKQEFLLSISVGDAGIVAPTGASWSGGAWNGASWSGGTWSGASWSGASWSGASWSGGVWSGASWSGASWSGASWSGASWSGASWSGASWSSAVWCGATWLGQVWS